MKRKIYLASAIALFGIFILFTATILALDVQQIGPDGSSVGLATLNGAFREAIGATESYNELWYDISELAGFAAIAIAGGFAILGLCQVIKRKSIFKVDIEIIILGAFYVIVLATYIGFELTPINFRPVLIEGELEASYPSSHTMLAVCFCSTAIFEFNRLLKKNKALMIIADVICGAIGITVIVGRTLSGAHWLTDIIAGILISAVLVCLYRFEILTAQNRRNKIAKKENAVND